MRGFIDPTTFLTTAERATFAPEERVEMNAFQLPLLQLMPLHLRSTGLPKRRLTDLWHTQETY
jgi:hypothetical protein